MNITPDVINDLLPAYLSGEASADTLSLVDEMAARDPRVARLVAEARDAHVGGVAEVSLPPNLERDVVARTRAILRRRSWTLALALFFSAMPLTFAFGGHGITFFMLRDEPASRLFWLAAAWMWFEYLGQTRRLRTKLPV
jgi:anti-sigma factor RsiW